MSSTSPDCLQLPKRLPHSESICCHRPHYPGTPTEFGHLNLMVQAPHDYLSDSASTSPLIFVDSHPIHRQLPPLGYQLVYTPTQDDKGFQHWSHQLIVQLRQALQEELRVQVDYLNLLETLRDNQTRQLRYALIDYDRPSKVPYQKLLGLRFQTLFAMLFAPAGLSIRYWSQLAESLSVMNPGVRSFALGMQTVPGVIPRLLLLGEPEL